MALIKKCPNCGKLFEGKHKSKRFCSDHCADQFYNEYLRVKWNKDWCG